MRAFTVLVVNSTDHEPDGLVSACRMTVWVVPARAYVPLTNIVSSPSGSPLVVSRSVPWRVAVCAALIEPWTLAPVSVVVLRTTWGQPWNRKARPQAVPPGVNPARSPC